jgi:putative serine protease PepD
VTPNGPAARAGITAGSVVQQLGGTPTPTVEVFLSALRRFGPGERAVLTLVPAGKQTAQTVSLVLADRPA